MANDYGYFGSGSTGYAHYKQAFYRNFGGSDGGGGFPRLGIIAGLRGLYCLVCDSGGVKKPFPIEDAPKIQPISRQNK